MYTYTCIYMYMYTCIHVSVYIYIHIMYVNDIIQILVLLLELFQPGPSGAFSIWSLCSFEMLPSFYLLSTSLRSDTTRCFRLILYFPAQECYRGDIVSRHFQKTEPGNTSVCANPCIHTYLQRFLYLYICIYIKLNMNSYGCLPL